MNVLMISPGFPDEMPNFTRALAEVGANVLGVGDQPIGAMEDSVRAALSDYLRVDSLWKEESVVEQVREWLAGRQLDRVECLWEPGVTLAARLREAFGLDGITVEQSHAFRDKERMKQVLDAAGVRTPKHARGQTQDECRAAAEEIGYPLIIKPIDGAGSADTYPLQDSNDLEDALARMGHVKEVSVEEYIEGEEFTFDTVCGDGKILFENVAQYRPKPLVARMNPWVSGQAICIRDLEQEHIVKGRNLGYQVIEALGFRSGFSHMEWFYTPSGEAVFGEIGARSPGGRLVHVMNYTCDINLFVGWAEAVCYGRLSQETSRKFNAGIVFKRAQGKGQITEYRGLDRLMSSYGEQVVALELNPIGSPMRDWRQVVSGDGWIVVRHPDLQTTMEIADRFGSELDIIAG
ncbi:MAG: carbamoylphosphate synthase large subunit [Planctomycetota bacterium]|jgi:carbamoylphosphate synthase large subunit